MAAETKVWLGTDGVSPNDWNTAANWSPSGVPAANNDVVITGAVDIDPFTVANQCGHLSVLDYTGQIGQPGAPLDFNGNFDDDAKVVIAGTGRMYIDLKTSATDTQISAPFVTVLQTANARSGDDYGLYLTAERIQKLVITGGSVALAAYTGDAVELTELLIQNGAQVPRVLIGTGVTPEAGAGKGSFYIEGGETILDMFAILDLLDISGGTTRKDCTQTLTKLNLRGGGYYIHQAGMITDFELYNNAVLDTKQSDIAIIFTAATIYGGTYRRHETRVTHTAQPAIDGGVNIAV